MAGDQGQGGDARPDDAAIRAEILIHALRRGRDKTFCPSEPARALSSDWRPLMPHIRRIAAATPSIR